MGAQRRLRERRHPAGHSVISSRVSHAREQLLFGAICVFFDLLSVGMSILRDRFHIGSPSDQTGSDFQSVRSRSTQSFSHPTASPVSFGPIGSPSVSGISILEGAVSSPGLMSDGAGPGSSGASFCAGVQPSSSGGSVQSPPGLPLSDPPDRLLSACSLHLFLPFLPSLLLFLFFQPFFLFFSPPLSC